MMIIDMQRPADEKKPTVSLGIPENESIVDAERDLDELAKS
ncbi:protein of unknown function [Candidatus Nitrosotalea okcheonensis]|uniref:Uncharacterized protein n=1 Tax=Candidatus Nitrosotalea okcheonensis TaxID=1903276 RepID=A0A2H1FID5_9ARCH|nr:protein of unknown function [Candidatus Nitrosotalea okcheonensis]